MWKHTTKILSMAENMSGTLEPFFWNEIKITNIWETENITGRIECAHNIKNDFARTLYDIETAVLFFRYHFLINTVCMKNSDFHLFFLDPLRQFSKRIITHFYTRSFAYYNLRISTRRSHKRWANHLVSYQKTIIDKRLLVTGVLIGVGQFL